MGRYNEFLGVVGCSACGCLGEVAFQADIGVLEDRRFSAGEIVWGLAPRMPRSPVGPEPGTVGRDVWAYGLGRCPNCLAELWAVVEVRGGRFTRLALTPEPENPDAWGNLPPDAP
ncbi:hypothetical protein COCOR_07575 [Corallococcus coralloides DSM 2259]|uniref:Lipoprotein n=1 Tax=Corallococcus coralloides (strain ATCC 25202 / DSM 2259 / NBRC 100086 / M2) TaxID=1144275 RepID=H8MQE2_CORCM|nr:hypothetical protein COCOR_07575 [Corallococcus coralloides DSM 2259]